MRYIDVRFYATMRIEESISTRRGKNRYPKQRRLPTCSTAARISATDDPQPHYNYTAQTIATSPIRPSITDSYQTISKHKRPRPTFLNLWYQQQNPSKLFVRHIPSHDPQKPSTSHHIPIPIPLPIPIACPCPCTWPCMPACIIGPPFCTCCAC